MNFIKRLLRIFIIPARIKPIIIVKEPTNLLEGRIALVTGGSSGIGAGIAKALVEAGAKVYLIGRDENKLKSISEQINASYIVLDITNISELSTKLEQLFANQDVDILVNSAGVHGNDTFGNITEKCFDSVINTNVKALYFVSQIVSNQMIKKKLHGHILNISSASSLKPSWTPYEISKRAVNGITQGMADKLIKHGIIVNAIAPGPTATPMMGRSNDISWEGNPSGRMSTVEEIASLAVYMVSPKGEGIVGDTFFITGGSGTICIDK